MTVQRRKDTHVDDARKLVPNGEPLACYPVRIPLIFGTGMNLVAAIYNGLWYVYESTTGLKINIEGTKTQKAAVKSATERMETLGKEVMVAGFKEAKLLI
jgi:hypothetical protein